MSSVGVKEAKAGLSGLVDEAASGGKRCFAASPDKGGYADKL
ncbi:hypothetical protein [Hoeflea phototrophica]|nr:hypothetical protein [Hoeflea phototrophica]